MAFRVLRSQSKLLDVRKRSYTTSSTIRHLPDIDCNGENYLKWVGSTLKTGEWMMWTTVVEDPPSDYGPASPQNSAEAELEQNLKLLRQQQEKRGCAEPAAYVSLLKQCSEDISSLKIIHGEIRMNKRVSEDRLVLNCLVEAYGKCGSLEDAKVIFSAIRQPNVYSWTILIAAYAHNEQYEGALILLRKMDVEGMKPNQVTYAALLGAASELRDLAEGRKLHVRIAASEHTQDVVLGTALINMYAKCGELHRAKKVFDRIRKKDLACWNSMISAFVQLGFPVEAVATFNQVQPNGMLQPNQVTYALLFRACAASGAYADARIAHMCFILSKLPADVVVNTALIDMYSKCGSLDDARRVFDRALWRNVVSWNVMIAAYAQAGLCLSALEIYLSMVEADCVKADEITFINVLEACSSPEFLTAGKNIHRDIVSSGFSTHPTIVTALLTMYAACGSLEHASEVFEGISGLNSVITWTAMVTAYSRNSDGRSALKIFRRMDLEGVKANVVTLVSCIDACSSLGALVEGHAIFVRVMETGYHLDVVLGTSLVDLYGKCGNLQRAVEIFEVMSYCRNTVTWNSLILAAAAYSRVQHGVTVDLTAELLLREMTLEGVELDGMTLLNLLSGCSHGGRLEEAVSYMKTMADDHGILPSSEHYGCLVDLLGRTGQLEEAEGFISRRPFESDCVLWMALLGGCALHSEAEIGVRAANKVLELEPKNSAAFVLLSGILLGIGRLDAVRSLRRISAERGVKKEASRSFVEVKGIVHEFGVAAGIHKDDGRIGAKLREWSEELVKAGFVPLHDVRGVHDEKLAIAYAMIAEEGSGMISVVKKLRMCVGCHSEIKFISRVTGRDISVRDGKWFHHFHDGSCSCGDFW